MSPDLSVLVLAGGDARRLGGRKAERLVRGRRLVDPALELAARVSDDVLLLGRGRELPAPGTRAVDDAPGLTGPLAGLAAGLDAARHDWCLLLPCDLPDPSAAVVDRLRSARDAHPDARAVVVRSDDLAQPFHGLYRTNVADRARTLGARRGRQGSLRALLDDLRASGHLHEVPLATLGADADGRFLRDVDTPAELARLNGRRTA